MTPIPFVDHAGLPTTERDYLANAFTPYPTLGKLLEWAAMIDPPLGIADIIAQDAYTHDVLIPLPTGRYLVFDTTCLGVLSAVAVWPHRPTPDQLLLARFADGWTPATADHADGERTLGNAACLFDHKR